MISKINRKILHAAMLRIEDCSSLALCALDTVVKIEEKYSHCENCVFRNVINMLVCPNEIKKDIEELR